MPSGSVPFHRRSYDHKEFEWQGAIVLDAMEEHTHTRYYDLAGGEVMFDSEYEERA